MIEHHRRPMSQVPPLPWRGQRRPAVQSREEVDKQRYERDLEDLKRRVARLEDQVGTGDARRGGEEDEEDE